MPILLVLIAVALVGVVAMVALGTVRGGLQPARPAREDHQLPDGPLTVTDVAGTRFSVAVRGYRMDEVDEFVDRVRQQLVAVEAELAELRAKPRPLTADEPW